MQWAQVDAADVIDAVNSVVTGGPLVEDDLSGGEVTHRDLAPRWRQRDQAPVVGSLLARWAGNGGSTG